MPAFDFAPLEPPVVEVPIDVSGVLEAAHAEAEQIRADAYAEGLAAGRAEALASLAPAQAALEAAVVDARTHAQALAERLEAEAVELAFAVAGKVLAAHVEADSGLVLESVRGALRGIVERERVTLLVNPDDLELVRGAGDELRGSLGGIEHCEVQAERRVGRGGAIVRYGDGQVDARLETKLERAREVVAASLRDGVS